MHHLWDGGRTLQRLKMTYQDSSGENGFVAESRGGGGGGGCRRGEEGLDEVRRRAAEKDGLTGVTLVMAALEGSFRRGFFFRTSSSSSYRYCGRERRRLQIAGKNRKNERGEGELTCPWMGSSLPSCSEE